MAEALLVVLEVVGPIFALILAGFVAAARGWVGPAGFEGLNLFAFSLAAPALLFASGTGAQGVAGGAALAFFLGCGALYAGVLLVARRRGWTLAAAGPFALNVTFGNTVMMGIPLVLAAFGPDGLAVLLGILALHAMLLLGTATVVAELAEGQGGAPLAILVRTAGGVLRNPIVMAVALALAWRGLGWPLPAGVRATLELLGAAAPPVSLFCLGASLTGFRAAGMWARTALSTVLKLLVLPLLVWCACRLLGLPAFETAVAVVAAALPTGANAFLIARRYRSGEAEAGASVLVSTLLSVLTLTALLTWLRPG